MEDSDGSRDGAIAHAGMVHLRKRGFITEIHKKHDDCAQDKF
jgi:hypothetical protein